MNFKKTFKNVGIGLLVTAGVALVAKAIYDIASGDNGFDFDFDYDPDDYEYEDEEDYDLDNEE